MLPDEFEVQAVRADGPAAIDSLGFYVLSENTTPAPSTLTATERVFILQEEEFFVSRICCYLRLSLELQQHRCPSDGGGSMKAAALAEARMRVGTQMKRRVRRFGGAPHAALRRLLWGFFSGSLQRPSNVIRAHHAMYESLATAPPDPEVTDVIQRDLGRTFPTHCLFVGEGSVGQRELQRILYAFSRFDPEVGYCQGMAFVVAMLLLHAPEEEAFGILLHLCHSPSFRLREMYLPGFPLLQTLLAVLRRLIERLLPVLHSHFSKTGINVAFFASQWFLTLFTYQFSLEIAGRLWDLFLVEGWRVVIQLTIAILQGEQEQLLSLGMEETLLWLKEFHVRTSTDRLLRRAQDVPLTASEFVQILRAEKEAQSEP